MNFTAQSLMLITCRCLVSLTLQLNQETSNQEIQLSSDEYNKMILIKYILKAYNEMKHTEQENNETYELDDEKLATSNNKITGRTEKRSNDKLKDFFIKRAMKNVALGFGRK